MSSKTPLLLLLDGILSQEQNQIRDAMAQISSIVRKARKPAPLTGPNGAMATPDSDRVPLSEAVRMLLEADPSLVSVPSDHDNSLPLHFAASLGSVRVASLLIAKYPAAASTPNSKGKIPLHYAAREGRTDMVAFLLHVDPSTAKIASTKQKLPIHFAAGEGHVNVVRDLLRAHPEGASVPSSKGKLPLHFAARWGHMQIAQDLLTVYPDGVRALDWEGSLPLHDAAREGQTLMAQLLMHRYLQGLSTANLRGEIPLFPAVRSSNVELVISLLQAWPRGGKHILKAVCADDDVANWDSDILELCLRGAVGNFYNCSILDGKRAPVLCRCDDVAPSGSVVRCEETSCQLPDTMTGPCQCDCKCHFEVVTAMSPVKTVGESTLVAVGSEAGVHGKELPVASQVVTDEPSVGLANETTVLIPRSKSPILEEQKVHKKRSSTSEAGERKRLRSDNMSNTNADHISDDDWPREFFALHAALECGANSHVLRCVLKTHPHLITQADSYGQLPLHVAMAHSLDEDGVQLVLDEILKPYPQAAQMRDRIGRLPLHIALSSQADFRLIKALLETNPSSGFDPCRTNDVRFADKMPILLATEFDCNLSSIYHLLRGDPTFVQEFI